jgi:hypothetical protein
MSVTMTRDYVVTKQTARSAWRYTKSRAVRWNVSVLTTEGQECTVGHLPTRREALQIARLLAGPSGSVTIRT